MAETLMYTLTSSVLDKKSTSFLSSQKQNLDLILEAGLLEFFS